MHPVQSGLQFQCINKSVKLDYIYDRPDNISEISFPVVVLRNHDPILLKDVKNVLSGIRLRGSA